MLIVLRNGTTTRPHMHLKKAEAFHLIERKLSVVLFADDGVIEHKTDLSVLSTVASERAFYFRIPARTFHLVIPISDTVVFREVTEGPFKAEETIYPDWT